MRRLLLMLPALLLACTCGCASEEATKLVGQTCNIGRVEVVVESTAEEFSSNAVFVLYVDTGKHSIVPIRALRNCHEEGK